MDFDFTQDAAFRAMYHFRAGAKWQKEQMMKEAIEAVARPLDKEIWCDLDKFPELEDGNDIHIIIIKEN